MIDPAVAMAREVLSVALADAQRTPKASTACAGGSDVLEARAFCLDPAGPWAESREIWCDTAGVHPEVFLRHATQVLGGIDHMPSQGAMARHHAALSGAVA